MRELSTTQRQYLRKQAHDLKPVVFIGKNGITDTILTSLDQVLDTRELIKVKFLDFQDQREELAKQLSTASNSYLVGIIGNIAILYREQADPTKRTIRLPLA